MIGVSFVCHSFIFTDSIRNQHNLTSYKLFNLLMLAMYKINIQFYKGFNISGWVFSRPHFIMKDFLL